MVLFTIIFIMMFWAHVASVTTNVGFLPKGYELLDQDAITPSLSILLKEKEAAHYEKIVKGKIEEGAIPSF